MNKFKLILNKYLISVTYLAKLNTNATMKLVLFLVTFVFSTCSFSQMNTFVTNPIFLLNSSFLGPNFIVSNVQYTGSFEAVGSFISDSTNLGLSKGIIMTTGGISGEFSPEGPNDLSESGFDNGADSTVLIQNSYNAAILEFDIVSSVDSLKIRYIFGSEEYPEYVGSPFNDQFQILLSGPGIVGYQLLSKLPNGTEVGINTVNAGQNSFLHINNGDGNQAPNNTSEYYIQYDGFTIPLVAKAAINPGLSYHVTIVIADVGDGILDSGIFLEQCESCNFNANVQSWSTNVITCFPNPSDGNVSLEFPELTSSAELRVINYLGEEIKRVEVASGAKVLSVNELPSGNYILKMISESAIWTGRVIVK